MVHFRINKNLKEKGNHIVTFIITIIIKPSITTIRSNGAIYIICFFLNQAKKTAEKVEFLIWTDQRKWLFLKILFTHFVVNFSLPVQHKANRIFLCV